MPESSFPGHEPKSEWTGPQQDSSQGHRYNRDRDTGTRSTGAWGGSFRVPEAQRCCKEPEEKSWELHNDKRIAAGKRMPARSQLREATAHELLLVKPSQNNVMTNF